MVLSGCTAVGVMGSVGGTEWLYTVVGVMGSVGGTEWLYTAVGVMGSVGGTEWLYTVVGVMGSVGGTEWLYTAVGVMGSVGGTEWLYTVVGVMGSVGGTEWLYCGGCYGERWWCRAAVLRWVLWGALVVPRGCTAVGVMGLCLTYKVIMALYSPQLRAEDGPSWANDASICKGSRD